MFRDWQIADLVGLVRARYPDWDGFGHGRFVAEELAPKRKVVALARELLGQETFNEMVREWQFEELLSRLERVGREGNLLFNRVPRQGDLAILYRAQAMGQQAMGEFAQHMQRLLYGAGTTPQRVQTFAAYALENHLPNRWPFPTYYLLMTQPQTELFVKPQVARWFLRWVGQGALYEATPSGRLYELLRGYTHGLLALLEPLGARDMVDVQSFLWVCARESRGRLGALDLRGQVELDPKYETRERGLVVHERGEAGEWALENAAPGTAAPEGEEEVDGTVAPYPLAQMANETGYDEEDLSRWARAIERKGQAILYGPPGTGKTMLAQALARHLVGGSDGFVDKVQLHPAYQYEDFVQGLRPVLQDDGTLGYDMTPGHFLKFCGKAAQREGRCVLIIDEINRANLSRVFGELMYLLEYRDESMALSGGGTLQIPANVRLIGTMNTADRSIALLDHAMRRRFALIPLQPNYDVLRRYHERRETGFDVDWLVKQLQRLNAEIGDTRFELGITYFLREDLAAHLADVWQMEVEPYLEELFFEQPEAVDKWRWERVSRGRK